MNKKILLLNPEIPGDILGGFPLSLAYLSSTLKMDGLREIRAIDYNIGESKALEDEIIKWSPDFIGVTMMVPSFPKGKQKIEELSVKIPNSKIFVGGIAAAVITNEVLDIKGVTGAYRGEGEKLISLLVKNSIGESWKNIGGVSHIHRGNRVDNEISDFINDLDSIPFPDRTLVPFEYYLQDIHGSDRKAASIISSRGCPYQCTFCYRGPAAGKKFRARSAENVVAEMDQLAEKGVTAFMFWDDNFMLNKNRVYEICDLIKHKGYEWKIQMRVDSADKYLLQKMRDSGCVAANIGIESGNEEVLRHMKKGITKSQARTAVRLCQENDIFVNAYFILGTPWDTPSSIMETINFAKEINPNKAHFFEATPYPGTVMREVAIKMGLRMNDSWGEYRMKKTDAPIFEVEAYSKEQLHRVINEANEFFRR
ncbi:MAG: B12-binding domain-containing radical SAM protein [Nanoarchaeota archaeon]|nr:B12-binding domain-containing radical SAM protein [Nanoarchaeota archaeon]MBU1322187.1 B12-binding domain-containing radical SAM protein [Nanoarchaeota archaeon]MBU1597728.1 B12-binding domain-containing radical SAM protein [Nanoarchaeota archaeon]MBU2442110.1 B12-binding domain-containing radical SAM protein [Nanoarchaeota archaeon]